MLRPFMKIDRHKRLSRLKRSHCLLIMLWLLMCTSKCQLYQGIMLLHIHLNGNVTLLLIAFPRLYIALMISCVCKTNNMSMNMSHVRMLVVNTRVNNAEFDPIRAPNERQQQHNNVSYGSCHL